MTAVMKAKQLALNLDKSCFLLLGNNKQVNIIREEIKRHPLTLNGTVMKEKLLDKYLGDYFCLNPGKSANKTVQHRYWKIVSAIMEIRSIIEDCRANYVGGVQAGIDLWKVGVVPP